MVFRPGQKGEASLIGLLVSMGIGTIVSLGVASVLVFGVNQYQLVVEQNKAQENLLMASFWVRAYLTQAVKTICNRNVGVNSPLVTIPANTNLRIGTYLKANSTSPTNMELSGAGEDYPPLGIGQGVVDCTGTTLAGAAAVPFALFVRDAGGQPAGGGAMVNEFRPSGIYFLPPGNPAAMSAMCAGCDSQSGGVILAQLLPSGGAASLTAQNGVVFDRIVSINAVPNSAVEPLVGGIVDPNGVANSGDEITVTNLKALQSIDIQITARYYKSLNFAARDYTDSCTTSPEPCKDLTQTIKVGLRNNWLGTNPGFNNQPVSERLYGNSYFYNLDIPPMINFAGI